MPALQCPAGGQPVDAAAQSGGSSGTGTGELQGLPATDALLSVAVICNGLRGLFHITKQVMECRCRSCQAKVRQRMCMPGMETFWVEAAGLRCFCMMNWAVMQHYAGCRIVRAFWETVDISSCHSRRRSATGPW